MNKIKIIGTLLFSFAVYNIMAQQETIQVKGTVYRFGSEKVPLVGVTVSFGDAVGVYDTTDQLGVFSFQAPKQAEYSITLQLDGWQAAASYDNCIINERGEFKTTFQMKDTKVYSFEVYKEGTSILLKDVKYQILAVESSNIQSPTRNPFSIPSSVFGNNGKMITILCEDFEGVVVEIKDNAPTRQKVYLKKKGLINSIRNSNIFNAEIDSITNIDLSSLDSAKVRNVVNTAENNISEFIAGSFILDNIDEWDSIYRNWLDTSEYIKTVKKVVWTEVIFNRLIVSKLSEKLEVQRNEYSSLIDLDFENNRVVFLKKLDIILIITRKIKFHLDELSKLTIDLVDEDSSAKRDNIINDIENLKSDISQINEVKKNKNNLKKQNFRLEFKYKGLYVKN